MNRATRSTPALWSLCESLLARHDVDAETIGARLDTEAVQDCRAAIEALELARGFDEPTVEPSHPLRVPEDYVVGELLGRGGMGAVYRAHQQTLDREVAIKVLRARDAASEAAVRRFRREATSLAQLRHRHIVPVFEVGEVDGATYFTMPVIRGDSLDCRLATGPMSPSRAVRLIRQVASAIAHAHSRGIVHRDLKPGNILIDEQGDAQVVDFGLAIDASRDATVSQGILGTPAYMSPEQARGQSEQLGEPTDIHALGAILYECLCGRAPYLGDSIGETLNAVIHSTPAPLRGIDRRIPRELERICDKAMAKRIDDRYPSASAFEADLTAFERGRPISISSGRFPAWLRPSRRNRGRAFVAIAAIVILSVIAILAYQHGRDRQERDPKNMRTLADRLADDGSYRAAGVIYDEILQRQSSEGSSHSADTARLLFVSAKAWLDAAAIADRRGDDDAKNEALRRAATRLEDPAYSIARPWIGIDTRPWLRARHAHLSGATFQEIRRWTKETTWTEYTASLHSRRNGPEVIAFFGERAVDPTHLDHEVGLFAFACRYRGAMSDVTPRDEWLLEDPRRVPEYIIAWVKGDGLQNYNGDAWSTWPLHWLSRNRKLTHALCASTSLCDRLLEIADDENRSALSRTLAISMLVDIQDLPLGPVEAHDQPVAFETSPELERELAKLYRRIRGEPPQERLRLRIEYAVHHWKERRHRMVQNPVRQDRRLLQWLARFLPGRRMLDVAPAEGEVETWWELRRQQDPKMWLAESIGVTLGNRDRATDLAVVVERLLQFKELPDQIRAHHLAELYLPPGTRAPVWNARWLANDGILQWWRASQLHTQR